MHRDNLTDSHNTAIPTAATGSVPATQLLQRWIGWAFFRDLFAGLRLTLSYMFSKTVTMQYPDREKWQPYPRFRGHHFLRTDEAGNNKCVACELCARICPSDCITVIPYEDEQGERHPRVFDIDLGRCLYCGLCEDACPVEAIALGSVYEFSAYTPEQLVVGRDQLLSMPGKTEQAGQVVSAEFRPQPHQLTVEPKQRDGYHWWDNILRHERTRKPQQH